LPAAETFNIQAFSHLQISTSSHLHIGFFFFPDHNEPFADEEGVVIADLEFGLTEPVAHEAQGGHLFNFMISVQAEAVVGFQPPDVNIRKGMLPAIAYSWLPAGVISFLYSK